MTKRIETWQHSTARRLNELDTVRDYPGETLTKIIHRIHAPKFTPADEQKITLITMKIKIWQTSKTRELNERGTVRDYPRENKRRGDDSCAREKRKIVSRSWESIMETRERFADSGRNGSACVNELTKLGVPGGEGER